MVKTENMKKQTEKRAFPFSQTIANNKKKSNPDRLFEVS